VIAIGSAIGGFTPGESDQLRRVMTHARSVAEMESLGELFCRKAAESGTDPAVAREIFTMLQGYASYGFPEAHAAAFAHTALRTAQLSARRPEALFAGLLSQQPMGYYPPHILVGEALRRGVRFKPLDIRRSESSYTVEGGAVRVGLCAVRGLGAAQRERILAARRERPFRSLEDLAARTGLKADELSALCDGGALDCFDRNRRRLLLQIGAPPDEDGLFRPVPLDMPDFEHWQRFWRQEAVLGLRGPSHLAAAARPALKGQGIESVRLVKHLRHGETVRVAGVPYRPHRPPTRSGAVVAFFMLEDETGLLDLVAMEDVYHRQGDLLFGRRPPLLGVLGRVQRRGRGITVRAEELFEPDLGLRVE
jgi:error-prone DNA polymerase